MAGVTVGFLEKGEAVQSLGFLFSWNIRCMSDKDRREEIDYWQLPALLLG